MTHRKKPLVVVTRKLPDSVETRMRELFDTRLNLTDKPMSHAELAEAARVALNLGQAVEARDRVAALALYTELRDALERLAASRWRGWGLASLAAEAGRLAEAAREPETDKDEVEGR